MFKILKAKKNLVHEEWEGQSREEVRKMGGGNQLAKLLFNIFSTLEFLVDI